MPVRDLHFVSSLLFHTFVMPGLSQLCRQDIVVTLATV